MQFRTRSRSVSVQYEFAALLREDSSSAPLTLAMTRQIAKRLLVVEDDVDSAEMLSMLLTEHGYDCRYVMTGAAALESVAEHRPEVVVLDIGMPDMNGIDVAHQIRALLEGHPVRMVALTGYTLSGELRDAAAAAFDEYLLKPLDLESLARALEG